MIKSEKSRSFYSAVFVLPVKVFEWIVQQGVGVCVCWAAARSSECQMVLVKLKKLSHSRLELCGVDHMLSGMTSLNSDKQNSQHPKLPAALVFSQALSVFLSSPACSQNLPENEGCRLSERRN